MASAKLSPVKERAKLRKAERRKKRRLKALLSAALAIPGIGLSSAALAQSAHDQAEVQFSYFHYEDHQKGEDRMRVRAPMLWAQAPVNENTLLEGSFVLDSLSGASPAYLSTLSGASGVGVKDIRRAGDLKLTHSFERFSLGVGGLISAEDDYLSRGGLIETKWWTEDKNTTINFGFGGSHDEIDSTLTPNLDESRDSQNYVIGVTQVINPVSLIQSNLSYSSGNGYFSDPYKSFDNRPESREQWAWLTRYIWYVAGAGASLHTDYRYYQDTWDIHSHTMEISWYQEAGEKFIVRPLVRYYSQDKASFFSTDYPPKNTERFLSYDQRMGDFGSISLGMKVSASITEAISLEAGYEWVQQRPSFRLGDHDSHSIEPFSMRFLSLGILGRF